jgi:hypothetical protein
MMWGKPFQSYDSTIDIPKNFWLIIDGALFLGIEIERFQQCNIGQVEKYFNRSEA